MTERPLFLKWLLLNILTTVFFITAGVEFHSKIDGGSRIAVPIILLLFLSGSIYGGKLCWRASDNWVQTAIALGERPKELDRIQHDALYLEWFAYRSQIAGIIATLLGFYVIITHGGSQGDFNTKLQGGAVALLGSFVGVLCSLILLQIERWIDHELSRP